MSLNGMRVLVTGVAGFIGFHVAKELISRGAIVVGIDNLNDYYNVALKKERLRQLSLQKNTNNFTFHLGDICDTPLLNTLMSDFKLNHIVNLAAQAGVRYSIINPDAYIKSNVQGFMSVLSVAQQHKVKHLVYASSSSVYGANAELPFRTNDAVDHPISIYAATKRSNELMAHVYSHQFNLPTTGLRFFTVYGPWGRPDMSPILFANAIEQGTELKVFNYGEQYRDFTYIDDVVQGVILTLRKPPGQDPVLTTAPNAPDQSCAPFRLFNIGAENPVHLLTYIEKIEALLEKKANKVLLPMQEGDIERTFSDITPLRQWIGYSTETSLDEGLHRFISWYTQIYKQFK